MGMVRSGVGEGRLGQGGLGEGRQAFLMEDHRGDGGGLHESAPDDECGALQVNLVNALRSLALATDVRVQAVKNTRQILSLA